MDLSYVLITPARNEASTIRKTLDSVVAQTLLPKRWIIVDDGSTDTTGTIVKEYAKTHAWIEMLQMPIRKERDFAGKANAFNTAYRRLQELAFDIVGNLDADVSFSPDYFEFLISKFEQHSTLGVAGTRYLEGEDGVANYAYQDVAGQCQIFRRECLESIGGYFPSRYGGVDWIAVRMARMSGWETRTFNEKTFFHHRLMSSAESNLWGARIRTGRKDYILGNHPLWQVLRVAYQMTRKPYIVGGLFLLWGYVSSILTRVDRPIPPDLIKFHRREQMLQLKSIVKRGFTRSRMQG